jgi:hypothetical protein
MVKKELKKIYEWMIEYYGKRCPEYEKGCACCEAWKLYDMLIGDKPYFVSQNQRKAKK